MRQYYGIDLGEEISNSKTIDTVLKQDQQMEYNKHRILVLGTGDSGKSTFIKQMVIKYAQNPGHSFPPDQLLKYKVALQRNSLETIQKLISVSDLDNSDETLQAAAETITDIPLRNFTLTPDIATTILKIWQSPEIQATYISRSHFQLHAAAHYFMENTLRFSSSDFSPTEEDILQAREVTSGIKETKVVSPDGRETIFIDVGGQRSERRKWLHVFDNCTAVVYVVDLNGYCQLLEEDNKTNRFRDSLDCLCKISENEALKNLPFLIFLNKYDLFVERLKQDPVAQFFEDFHGTDDDALEFFKAKVIEAFHGNHMYAPYVTCAIDSTAISKVWEDCEEILSKAEESVSNRKF